MRITFIIALTLIFLGFPMGSFAKKEEKAVFAGGCFWCMEPEFVNIKGVVKVTSGYTGGTTKNPTYQDVLSGSTGHVEAIEVVFDSQAVPYTKLLEIFWSNVDPLDPDGQFCDQGEQYRAGIFYNNEEQKKQAEQSLTDIVRKLKQPVATFLREGAEFYPAEDYHQKYYSKNKIRYKMYRDGCGRDARLKKVNKMMSEE